FLFLVGTIARIQTHNVHFVVFVPAYTEIVQVYVTALSEHMHAVAEALLLTTPENRLSDNQDPDFEKLELADRERELWMLPRRGIIRPWLSRTMYIFGLCELGDVVQRAKCEIVYCIAFADDLVIPQFRLSVYKQLNNAGSNRMAEP
ncbi:hypothetical protein H4R23_003369, partial [Coemansia sp. Cherry 401B]